MQTAIIKWVCKTSGASSSLAVAEMQSGVIGQHIQIASCHDLKIGVLAQLVRAMHCLCIGQRFESVIVVVGKMTQSGATVARKAHNLQTRQRSTRSSATSSQHNLLGAEPEEARMNNGLVPRNRCLYRGPA